MTTSPFLRVRQLSKSFDGVTVVDHVDLDVASGEIVGLVGPNGCGKSTIIKVLSGFHQPDAGSEIAVGDLRLEPGASRHRQGMAFVHQDLGLVPALPVVENLALGAGYRTGRLWRIDWRAERDRARRLLEEYRIRAEPDTLVRAMAPADVTLLAIARALTSIPSDTGSLLVLDEPTSSLTDTEVERVLEAIRAVASRGTAVLFVSHRLKEVLSLCSRVNVMRDGRIVAERSTAGLTERSVVELMLGRPLDVLVPDASAPPRLDPVLSIRGLSGRRLADFSLEVHTGEIVGVTGLLGSGKTELGRLLSGADRRVAGEILVSGRRVALRSPREAIAAGISYVPPERRTQAAIGPFDAMENLTLPDLGRFFRGGRLDSASEYRETLAWMGRTHAVPAEPRRRFTKFSGGNQQKLVFAKWFRLDPRILVLDEPTQGVDVGAVRELYELVVGGAEDGVAVLLLSSEWDDMARICHRVVVLDRGRTVAELQGTALTSDHIAAEAFAAGRASLDAGAR